MKPINYVLIGFGGIAEHRIAREGFACGHTRTKVRPETVLIGATDLQMNRYRFGLRWIASTNGQTFKLTGLKTFIKGLFKNTPDPFWRATRWTARMDLTT